MKKKIISGILVLLVLSVCNVAGAQEEKNKGANPKAYEHANENAVFNRVGDWFATVGKSDEEKEKIKAERKAKRELKRAEKKAKKALKKKDKEMKDSTAAVESDVKDFKNKMKKKKKKHK